MLLQPELSNDIVGKTDSGFRVKIYSTLQTR